MVSITTRWNALRQMFNIRCGPGAAILPPEVSRIHMEFAVLGNNGHVGPKKFWKTNLPRLKYHNPAIPMVVNRKPNQEGTATMSIYFNLPPDAERDADAPTTRIQPTSSTHNTSKAPAPSADERVVRIDMKHKHSDEILRLFMLETGARQLEMTEEEKAEGQELEKLGELSIASRAKSLEELKEKRKEETLLVRARKVAGIEA